MKEPLKLRDFGGYKMMLECGGVDDKYLFRQNLNKLPERIQKLMERRRLECIDSPKKPPPYMTIRYSQTTTGTVMSSGMNYKWKFRRRLRTLC